MDQGDKDKIAAKLRESKEKARDERLASLISGKIAGSLAEYAGNIVAGFSVLGEQFKKLEAAVGNIKMPEVQNIAGEVKIGNAADLIPKEIVVKNPTEVVKIGNPDEVGAKAVAELRGVIEGLVNEIAKMQVSANVKEQLALESLRGFLSQFLAKQNADIIPYLKNLDFLSNDPKRPLSVRLSDGEQFYKAVMGAVSAAASNSRRVEDLLEQILAKTSEVNINADTIELNTDTLETLLGQFKFTGDKLKVDATFDTSALATEATLLLVKAAVVAIQGQLDVALSTRASEATLASRASEATLLTIAGYLDTVEAKLQSIIDNTDSLEVNTDELESRIGEVSATPTANTLQDRLKQLRASLDAIGANIDVALSSRASEATLSLIKGNLDALNGYVDGLESALATLNGKDFATQTTLALIKTAIDEIALDTDNLALIKAKTDNIDVAISTRASEATLAAMKAVVDLIKAKTDNLDVALSTRATEASLASVKTNTDDIKTKLDTLHADVDGVETLLTAIRDYVDTLESLIGTTNSTLSTIHSDLDTVEAKLQSLIDQTDTVEAKLQTIIGNQTNGTQQSKITDGTDVAEVLSSFNPTGTENGLVARVIPRKVEQQLTATPLGIAGVFTSAWFDTMQTGGFLLFIRALADQQSAFDGFIVETTDDTTNPSLTRTANKISVPASSLTLLVSSVRSRYWRVKYTNGGVAQGSFILTATESTAYVPAMTYQGETRIVALWEERVNAGSGFTTTTDNITVAGTAQVAFFLMKNASTSIKRVRIKNWTFGSDQNDAGRAHVIRIYRDPTITGNGTALSINNLVKGGAASAITAFKTPTISANGTLLETFFYQAEARNIDEELGFQIQPNENILITVQPEKAGVDHFITVKWIEE